MDSGQEFKITVEKLWKYVGLSFLPQNLYIQCILSLDIQISQANLSEIYSVKKFVFCSQPRVRGFLSLFCKFVSFTECVGRKESDKKL